MKSRTGYVQIVMIMEHNRERKRNVQQPLGSRFMVIYLLLYNTRLHKEIQVFATSFVLH